MVENPGDFKVADRRLFNEEGELRPGAVSNSDEAQTVPGSHESKNDGSKHNPSQLVSFNALIFSLYSSGMIQLGLVPDPVSGKVEKEPDEAKQTIDLLAILQEKTKGNLTAEESQLLEASLYELKMSFLQCSNRIKL